MNKIHYIFISWLGFLFCLFWVAHFFPTTESICRPTCNWPGAICLASETCSPVGKWAARLISNAFIISLFLYLGFALFHLAKMFLRYLADRRQ